MDATTWDDIIDSIDKDPHLCAKRIWPMDSQLWALYVLCDVDKLETVKLFPFSMGYAMEIRNMIFEKIQRSEVDFFVIELTHRYVTPLLAQVVLYTYTLKKKP